VTADILLQLTMKLKHTKFSTIILYEHVFLIANTASALNSEFIIGHIVQKKFKCKTINLYH
jgi:hypothetical protein